jgi:hypothetical protein
MDMSRWNLCAAAVAFALSAVPASGGVVIEIGSIFAGQGSSGNTIEVDVRNTGGSSIVIAGFNFEINADSGIDFTGADFSTSALYVFAGDSWDQANSQPLNTSTGSSLSAGDIFNIIGNGVTLDGGQTMGLALVTFDVSPMAALGPVTVSFSTDPADTILSDPGGDPIPIDSFESGTIDVTAPEPSTAAMLLAALMGLGAWRLMRPEPAASGAGVSVFAAEAPEIGEISAADSGSGRVASELPIR